LSCNLAGLKRSQRENKNTHEAASGAKAPGANIHSDSEMKSRGLSAAGFQCDANASTESRRLMANVSDTQGGQQCMQINRWRAIVVCRYKELYGRRCVRYSYAKYSSRQVQYIGIEADKRRLSDDSTSKHSILRLRLAQRPEFAAQP
jgi:hypothetical protein